MMEHGINKCANHYGQYTKTDCKCSKPYHTGCLDRSLKSKAIDLLSCYELVPYQCKYSNNSGKRINEALSTIQIMIDNCNKVIRRFRLDGDTKPGDITMLQDYIQDLNGVTWLC